MESEYAKYQRAVHMDFVHQVRAMIRDWELDGGMRNEAYDVLDEIRDMIKEYWGPLT